MQNNISNGIISEFTSMNQPAIEFLESKAEYLIGLGFEERKYSDYTDYVKIYPNKDGYIVIAAHNINYLRISCNSVEQSIKWQCDYNNPRTIAIYTPISDWAQIKRDIKWIMKRTIYPPMSISSPLS